MVVLGPKKKPAKNIYVLLGVCMATGDDLS
jgi:hypothetical protein